MSSSPSVTAKEIADQAALRYETDAEFHAVAFHAAQVARAALCGVGESVSFAHVLLGASVALLLSENERDAAPGNASGQGAGSTR